MLGPLTKCPEAPAQKPSPAQGKSFGNRQVSSEARSIPVHLLLAQQRKSHLEAICLQLMQGLSSKEAWEIWAGPGAMSLLSPTVQCTSPPVSEFLPLWGLP